MSLKSKWPGNVRQIENLIIRAIINTKNPKPAADDVGFAMARDKGMEDYEEKLNAD